MAWNEPGNGNDRNPRGGGNQNPPDLDELWRNFMRKLKRVKIGNGSDDLNFGSGGPAFWLGPVFVFLVAFVLWTLSGIFIVDPAEEAVVLRFGRYVRTVGPGPHWIPRIFEERYVVNVQKVYNFSYTALMLNQDENIVSVSLAVQYRIDNPRDFLFNVADPVNTLKNATASALRQIAGQTSLDDIMTVGREKVRQLVMKQLRLTMLRYKAGLMITDVVLQPARAPEEVKAAFDDAIKAEQDEERFKNQAQAYQRGVESRANGAAKRITQEAMAYKAQVILKAKGDVQRFLAILPEYKRAPEVTRERLYLDTIEGVMMNVSKVMVDLKGGNQMFYLPLEQLLRKQLDHSPLRTKKVTSTVIPSLAKSTSSATASPTDLFPRSPTSRKGLFQ